MPTARVNGVRLYYEEHGTGDPILCIHGTSGSAMTWAGASEALSKLGRVVLYDRRGSARSERPDPYTTSVAQQAEDAAAKHGSLVAETFLRHVLGDAAWESFLSDVRATFSDNSPAILPEVRGPGLEASAGDLAHIDVPVLLVAAEESPPEFRRLTELTAAAIPAARTVLVGGGHMIDPAGPEVLQFITAVLAGQQTTSDATAAVRAP